ncbi:MAG: acyltransferase domain-containing protein [Solirubrobacteraceae bacterium]|nr:acyltransferase domain-containing protein [Solirubrobacteraceae bacterium]
MSDSREAEKAALVEWLTAAVADLLEVEPEEVDPDRPLTELGISSRDGVGLVGELEDHLDRDLDPVMVFETPTINLIAHKLVYGELPDAHKPVGGVKVDLGADVPDAQALDAGDDAIAIVGLSCRLPGGVSGSRELWEFLINGQDGIREVPEDRWGPFTPRTGAAAAVVQNLNRWGGYLDDVSGFDAEFFGIAPREAELMDPQQRMLLEVAWEAIEDAGIQPGSLRGSATGVYVGMSANEYSHLTAAQLERVDAYVATGAAFAIASNRLSYLLDLRGPSMTVDTACSSGLVALHQAAHSIAVGESDTAIVGGVNLALAPAITYTFDQAGAMAKNGRIKAFSADADGMVRAEGCGVVILKRLADARRDGNHVLAVMRGSAVNQDGRSNGITAPNPAAQEAVLQTAYERVGIDPHSVDYVEAHGTGTLLGDPIEAGALGAVLGGDDRPGDKPLLIGSAKTNFGHLEAAAGIVGVMKTVLSLYHGQIPPSLNFSEPNPHIKFDENHLSVVTEPTEWPRYSGVARAGVSAFGFGGTNAHVVLEESTDRNRRNGGALPGEDDDVTTLTFSGSGESRVRAAAAALVPWLEEGAGRESALRDVAHSLARTRVPGRVRGSVTARGRDGLLIGLRALAEGLDAPNVVAPDAAMGKPRGDKGIVWIFSGYGSAWNGMGRRLLVEEPAFAQAIDELEPMFQAEVGWSLREAIEVDQDYRDSTKSQILLYGMHVALAATWRSKGIEPGAIMGHSMGEVAAAVVAGALSPADGVKLISLRSVLMEIENKKATGGMAVLQAAPQEFEAVADQFPGVVIAVYGSPKAITISGPKEPLNAAAEHFKEMGRGAWVLPVGGAAHSPQVDIILDEFAEKLAGITPLEPTVPYYSTANEDPREAPSFDIDYWQRNVRHSVRFMQAIGAAAEDGFTTFLEVSPHPVAEITTRQTLKAAGVERRLVLPTLRRDGDDGVSLATSLAALHAWHVSDTLDQIVPSARRVPLPFWQHRRFWLEGSHMHAQATGGHPLLGQHIALPEGNRHVWKADVGMANLPWMRDHTMHGVPVLPASAYAELAASAAAVALGGLDNATTLTNLELGEILALGEHTEITTSVTVTDGVAEFAVYTAGADASAPMVLRAKGTVSGDGSDGVESPTPSETANPVDLYELFRAAGLDHGPAFAGITDAQLHEDGWASARVSLPLAALRDQHYRVHPALIDACFQALAISGSRLGVDAADAAFMAGRVERMAIQGDPQRGGQVLARIEIDTERGVGIGTVRLLSDDGELLISADGIELRQITKDDLPEEALAVADDQVDQGVGVGRDLIMSLAATDPAAARQLLGTRLLERIAAVMSHAPEDLDLDAPLTEIGLDSLMATRAKSAVEADLGIEIQPKILLAGGSLSDMEDAIAQELGLGEAAPRRVSLIPRSERYIEPRDPTERFIAAIWEDVLDQRPLSATAVFDELGGTPEQADAVVEKMRERLGPDLETADVFAKRSIEDQADVLRELVEGNGGNPVRVLRQGEAGRAPLFLFHPAGGPTSVYANLVELLDEHQPVYGFERLEGVRTLEEKASHYIAMLRDIAPHGPYRLGGWSLGGCLAYEVAQQLKGQGEEIDFVAMIDTTIPKSTPGVTERELLRDRFERWFEYMSETYGVPIDIDVDALVELDEDEQVNLMLGLLKDSGIQMGAGVIEHQRTSYIDSRIAERYVPEPYDGKIVLYRATDRGLTTTLDPRYARDEEALGWDQFTTDLEIVHVQGTHITVIDHPGVATMAEHMRGALGAGRPVAASGDSA